MLAWHLATRCLPRCAPSAAARWSRAVFPTPSIPHYSPAYSVARLRALGSAAPAVAAAGDDDGFYAPPDASFASLGLDPRVCTALAAAGFSQPSHAQFLAAPPILDGRHVVLAAETGSGKTLAYLAPLISAALSNRAASEAARAAADATPPPTPPPPADDWAEPLPWFDDAAAAAEGSNADFWRIHRPTATLVLCPNAQLCQQVVAVATAAFGAANDKDSNDSAPLVRVALVSSQSPPPRELPDVVVTTPGALASLLDGAGPAFGADWTRAGLPAWAKHVVLDEADLLLGGGYEKHLNIILDALKAGDREAAARRACAELGIPLEEYWEMPRLIRKAVQTGGAKAALEAGYKPPKGATPPAEGTALPWLRQYIYVAATMPREGGKTVGADIHAAVPDAVWLAGRQLHRARAALEHAWRRFDSPADRDAALADVILSDPLIAQGKGRVMVFAKDVSSADATAGALSASLGASGPPVLLYHRSVPIAERDNALRRLSTEEGLVLVCTDAAARGIDVPDITHVVQADFAGSAIDFLHRVGRTARAGKSGRVTSLYAAEVAPLVDAIREAVAAGRPVEGAFSRKRSFKKKFKKYGKFVPRGEGTGAPARQ